MVREKLVTMRWVALFWATSVLMLMLDAKAAARQDMTLLIVCLLLTGFFLLLGVAFAIQAARKPSGTR